ncbi:MAG: hypothetical protein H8E46_09995 [FCB group bacterium]|nr:hypothetical protein [FCB group bacterium]
MPGKYKPKYSVGIFFEGDSFHFVKMARAGTELSVVEAQIFRFPAVEETHDETPAASIENGEIENIDLDNLEFVDEDIQTDAEGPPDSDPDKPADSATILQSAFSSFAQDNYKLAVCVSEPDIYYSFFDSDWGLKSKQLTKKVIEELGSKKVDENKIRSSDVDFINLADGRLMAVVRDREIAFLETFDNLKRTTRTKLPKIDFVESIEISIANLVKSNYHFTEDTCSIIVYIGNEFSRLIFLEGNEIIHVSQLIGEGYNSHNISNIIYSRILFEQDNLNLEKVDNLVLSGKISGTSIRDFLDDSFNGEINVEVFKFNDLDTSKLTPQTLAILPEFVGAIGAALRILDSSISDLYEINLIPYHIKSGQKMLHVGVPGWILIGLIFITVSFGVYKSQELIQELSLNKNDLMLKNVKLIEYNDLQQTLDNAQARIIASENSINTLNKVIYGTKTWSTFLAGMVDNCKNTGQIWITDILSVGPNEVQILGYSLYRNRISRIIRGMDEAVLEKVDVTEIREKTIYKFTIRVYLKVI